MVPYVYTVVAETVVHVLLSVCMLRECESVRVTTMLGWEMDEVWLW